MPPGGRQIRPPLESATVAVPVSSITPSTSLLSRQARTSRRLDSVEHAKVRMKENNDCLTHPAVTTTDLRTLPIHEEFDFYTITIEMLIFDMVIDSSAIEMGSLYVLGKTKIAVAEMGDHLATIVTGRKVGVLLCTFPWGSWVPHLT